MPLLEAVGISKRYGGVLALNKMHFAADGGEVHAILGENGAGKSTFIQILSGAVAADEGELKLDGAAYRPRGPREARRTGISPVFQELSLIADLTVAENIFFGEEQLSAIGTISQRDLNEKASALFASLGLEPMRPDAPVRSLSIGDRQIIEIVKALASDPKILILDEATSALLPREVDWLLNKARERAAEGKLVLYISHRMDEVRRVADRVTVLRNGETVGTESTSSLSDDDIVSMMLGRRLDRLFPERKPTATGRAALKVTNLKVGHQLRGVSFELREGEVLGVAGLQGHGQRELFMALFGAERAEGQVEVWGKPVTIRSPGHALSPEIGMALLPEDRRNQGLLLGKPVRENIVLQRLQAHRQARTGRSAGRAQAGRGRGGAAPHQGRFDRAGRGHAVGRQPAEGRARQAPRDRGEDPALLRPDARRRCRHQGGDLRLDARSRVARFCHPVLFDRPCRARACRRPHAGDELRQDRRHA